MTRVSLRISVGSLDDLGAGQELQPLRQHQPSVFQPQLARAVVTQADECRLWRAAGGGISKNSLGQSGIAGCRMARASETNSLAGLKFLPERPFPNHCSTIGRRWSNVSLSHAARGEPEERGRPREGNSRLTASRWRLAMERPPLTGRPFCFPSPAGTSH